MVTDALARPVPIACRRWLIVAIATGAVTTAVGALPLPARPADPPAVSPGAGLGVAALAHSIPHRARISGAPGNQAAHATAAAPRMTRAIKNCFQAANSNSSSAGSAPPNQKPGCGASCALNDARGPYRRYMASLRRRRIHLIIKSA